MKLLTLPALDIVTLVRDAVRWLASNRRSALAVAPVFAGCERQNGSARRLISASACMLAVLLAFGPVSAHAACNGRNGPIADLDSPVHTQLASQLGNIAGDYCGEANGSYMVGVRPIVDNQPCNMAIGRDGVITLVVGAKKFSWKQTLLMALSPGEHGVKTYSVMGGTDSVSAIFQMIDNRLAGVTVSHESAKKADGFEHLRCEFRFVSRAAGVPERSHFASGNSLPLASVGAFDGLDNNGSLSCRLSIDPTGQVRLSFTTTEGTLSSSGELRGRFHDALINGQIKTTRSHSDSWHGWREVQSGPAITLSSKGAPLSASAMIGGTDRQCRVGEGNPSPRAGQ